MHIQKSSNCHHYNSARLKSGMCEQIYIHNKYVYRINCNVDLHVGGIEMLARMNASADGAQDHASIDYVNQLQQTFAHFLRYLSSSLYVFIIHYLYSQGAPAERYISNPDDFAATLAVATTL